MVVIHYCVRRKPGMSFKDFSAYWSGTHAALVRRLAPQIGVIRYVQHHAIAPDAALQMRQMRGTSESFDGVAEIGFESFEALAKGNLDPAAAEAQVLLAEDEARFIDTPRSSILFTESRQVIV